jgi:glycerophosphoryl diester phosphodiesterase
LCTALLLVAACEPGGEPLPETDELTQELSASYSSSVTVDGVTYGFSYSSSGPATGTRWQISDLFASAPAAIGHRGFGADSYTARVRLPENKAVSVDEAFYQGVTAAEIDVHLTADGQVVVRHDDTYRNYLGQTKCVIAQRYWDISPRDPLFAHLGAIDIYSLRSRSSQPSGLMLIELKPPTPHCDPNDTYSMAALVRAVRDEVRAWGFTKQVALISFSPLAIEIAAREAPEIARGLLILSMQLLPPSEITRLTGLPVTIEARTSLGLTWARAGNVLRAPLYSSYAQYLKTAATISANIALVEANALVQGGSTMVGATRQSGFKIFSYTVNSPTTWNTLAALKIDGIITDDVLMGVGLQGP